MAAAAASLLEAGARPEISILVTHCLLVDQAASRLEQLPIQRIITTYSVPGIKTCHCPIAIHTLSQLLADALLELSRSEVG
jgi:phosphoribosylpyrophosphate synthetase